MTNINLKEYTKKAKDLEAAIYTEKKLLDAHADVIKLQYPIAPTKREVKKPDKPQTPYMNNEFNGAWILIVFFIIMGVLGITLLCVGEFSFFALVGIGLGIFGVLGPPTNIKSSV